MNKKKLKILDSSYFFGKNYFEGNDEAQNEMKIKLINGNQKGCLINISVLLAQLVM